MTDVFLSYKHEDYERIAPLHAALVAEGFHVFWDRDIPSGERWRVTLTARLDEARCVVVVWSHGSTADAQGFVFDEAARAKERGVLLPVQIDPVDLPLGFGELQTLDLIGWSPEHAEPRFDDLLTAIRAQLESRPRPAPRGPALRRRRRRLVAAMGVLLLTGVTLVLSSDARRLTCTLPGVRPVCAHYGIGGVPTPDEHKQWTTALERTDGEGLRAYLEHYPQGAHAAEARSRLAACRWVESSAWVGQTKTLPLVVRSASLVNSNSPAHSARPTEVEAREDARMRASGEAATLCEPYANEPFRLLAASFEVDRWMCSTSSAGWTCGFDGRASCQVQARQTHRDEICRNLSKDR